MNSLMTNERGILDETLALRHQLMDLLSDGDLATQFPDNMTLGELCREIGEVDRSYIDSFKTFKQDFSYKCDDPQLATSVDALKAWYATLEAEMVNALEVLSEDEVANKLVDRGEFKVPIRVQFHIYREALLIFYGRASMYMRALGKSQPQQWQQWIG